MSAPSPVPIAALIAFIAVGANLLGTALLILINPRSREVRWHAAFTFWVICWLALQGWFAAGGATGPLVRPYAWSIHLMPAFFLAATLVETHQVRNRTALFIVAAALATAEFLGPLSGNPVSLAWQATLWGTGALLHVRDRRSRGGGAPTGERALKFALLVVVPVGVIGVIALRGGFLLYVMPLVTILVQFLIFIGVVHHRFYDVEVRAARSGELAARAAEQERLALLGELSATLAHEIRNPLTGMRSLAQRLTGPGVDEDRRTRYAAVILQEIGRLDRIVGNLLDLSRRTVVRDAAAGTAAGDPAATQLEPLFDDLVLLVDGRARRAGVSIRRDAGRLAAAAPRDPLAQALLNLLLNAIAHTPAGGTVTLDATAARDGRLDIRVSDTGPGVPPEARDEIFQPFHTRGVGAGLGLAVVRRLARELEWDVSVSDAPGGGARFCVRVPHHAGAAGSRADAAPAPAGQVRA
jgi:signal transduction histidine kinase